MCIFVQEFRIIPFRMKDYTEKVRQLVDDIKTICAN